MTDKQQELKKAAKIINEYFKRIKYFKSECDSCIPDEVIEVIDILNKYTKEY